MARMHVTVDTIDQQSTAVEQSVSTFDIAVDKIQDETGRPRLDAITGLAFIEDMVAKARAGDARVYEEPGLHHLTGREMASIGYDVMDDIMEHGARAVPGSAHAAVEAHVLGPNEFSLVHDNPTGEKSDCRVTIGLDSMS